MAAILRVVQNGVLGGVRREGRVRYLHSKKLLLSI
jgi:hypothetical protein